MCSLTWRRDPSIGLEVQFNRDELKTRPIAEPPSLFEAGGSSFLSPRDPKGGGTWMLVNERGVVICLLNKWELEGREIAEPRSRGKLVWSLASLTSLSEIEEILTDLDDYQAFTLVVFTPSGDRCWEWNGESLQSQEVPPFLTSSSYEFEAVRAEREAAFLAEGQNEDFHASPGRSPSAFTVRMNRPDAQTWSRSCVRISEKITWEYLAEQPNLAGLPELMVADLPLRNDL